MSSKWFECENRHSFFLHHKQKYTQLSKEQLPIDFIYLSSSVQLVYIFIKLNLIIFYFSHWSIITQVITVVNIEIFKWNLIHMALALKGCCFRWAEFYYCYVHKPQIEKVWSAKTQTPVNLQNSNTEDHRRQVHVWLVFCFWKWAFSAL